MGSRCDAAGRAQDADARPKAWPRRPGLYRCVAKDGTVAGVLVADVGGELRVVELITVGRIEPPARRPRPRRIADDFGDLARQAERQRLERLARLYEELAAHA